MSNGYAVKKSPFLAALFSAMVPGLGQLYNEQVSKGIFILFLFMGSLLIFVSSVTGYSFYPVWTFLGGHHPYQWEFGMSTPDNFARLYFLVWLFVILPILYIYSIADAAVSSLNINRMGFATAGVASMPHHGAAPHHGAMPNPPGQPGEWHTGISDQDRIRQEAQENMNATSATPPPNSFAHNERSAKPGAANSGAFQQDGAAPHEHGAHHEHSDACLHRWSSGRMILGVILFCLGFFIVADQWNLEFLSFTKVWPLIPLLFGFRMLKDYKMERNMTQFILGIVFTLVGGVFLVENWGIAEPFRYIDDLIPFMILGVGMLLILQEMKARKHTRQG